MSKIDDRKRKLLERNKATYAGMTPQEQVEHFAKTNAAERARKAKQRGRGKKEPRKTEAKPGADVPVQPDDWAAGIAQVGLKSLGKCVSFVAYLRTDDWKAAMSKKLIATGSKCERCGHNWRLMVRHLHARSIYAETNEDLEVICGACRRDDDRKARAKR